MLQKTPPPSPEPVSDMIQVTSTLAWILFLFYFRFYFRLLSPRVKTSSLPLYV